MEHTEAAIVGFLQEKAKESWQGRSPYFLSAAPLDLRVAGVNYRDILGAEKLKAFVKRTEQQGQYKLVEHPVQKAKVGIVPAEAEFTFEVAADLAQPSHEATGAKTQFRHRRALIEFLRALSDLPDKDIESVVIPANVLVKLLKK